MGDTSKPGLSFFPTFALVQEAEGSPVKEPAGFGVATWHGEGKVLETGTETLAREIAGSRETCPRAPRLISGGLGLSAPALLWLAKRAPELPSSSSLTLGPRSLASVSVSVKWG